MRIANIRGRRDQRQPVSARRTIARGSGSRSFHVERGSVPAAMTHFPQANPKTADRVSRSLSAQTSPEAEIRRLCGEIEKAITLGSHWKWIAGDLLGRVTSMYLKGKRVTLKHARERYMPRLSYPMLSQLRSTAAAFPERGARKLAIDNSVSWYECDVARRMLDNLRLKGAVPKDHPIEDVLQDFICNKGLARNLRAATKRRITARIDKARDEALKHWAKIKRQQPPWLACCHNRSCLDVLAGLEDRSATVLWFDPPYAQYVQNKDGGHDGGRNDPSGLLTDCDANTREDAIRLTTEGVRRGFRCLNDRGVMILFQAATEPDRPEVILAARGAGYTQILPLYWAKRNHQPGHFDSPFTVSTERILLMARSGSALSDFDPMLRRGDVVEQAYLDQVEKEALDGLGLKGFRSPSQDACYDFKTGQAQIGRVHVFEKPWSLARFFFRKLTLPGDLAVDMCGCSGSMVEAAIRSELRWQYCETNAANFAFGVQRIQAALAPAGTR